MKTNQWILAASIVANVVLAVGVVYCFDTSDKKKETQTSTPTNDHISCDTCDDYFCGLTGEELMNGIARYKNTHWELINTASYPTTDPNASYKQNFPDGDARSCWYSTDVLKKFICQIEKNSECIGLSHDKLGIRFFYAVYSKEGSEAADQNFKSHQTLFMVPTYYNDKLTGDIEFDPIYNCRHGKNVNNGNIVVLGSSAGSMPDSTVFVLGGKFCSGGKEYVPGLMARNQGQVCPPYCPPPPRQSGIVASPNGPLLLQYVDFMNGQHPVSW